jgi:hypothetical protein
MKDMTHKTTLTALAIVAAATLTSLPAASQPVRRDFPPRLDRMPLQRPAPDGVRETSFAAEGTVRQYLMNPRGEVDGLLLNDSTQINFPPHMADELIGAVKPGQQVNIQGDRERDSVVKAEVITNRRTGQSVVEHAPSWKDRRMPPHLEHLSMHGWRQATRLSPYSMRRAGKSEGSSSPMAHRSMCGPMSVTAWRECSLWEKRSRLKDMGPTTNMGDHLKPLPSASVEDDWFRWTGRFAS